MSKEFPAVTIDRARYLIQQVIESEDGAKLALYRALMRILTIDLKKKGAAFSTRINLGALGENPRISLSFSSREQEAAEHLVKFATVMREAGFYGEIYDASEVVYNLTGKLEPVHATFAFGSFELDMDSRKSIDISEFAMLLATIILRSAEYDMRNEISLRVREAKMHGQFQPVQDPNLNHTGKESFGVMAINALVIPFFEFLEAVQSNGQRDLNL